MIYMQRRIGFLLLSLTIALSLMVLLLWQADRFSIVYAAPATNKIDPALLEALMDGTAVRFMVDLADTAVAPTLDNASTEAQRTAVLETLQKTAASSQADGLRLTLGFRWS